MISEQTLKMIMSASIFRLLNSIYEYIGYLLGVPLSLYTWWCLDWLEVTSLYNKSMLWQERLFRLFHWWSRTASELSMNFNLECVNRFDLVTLMQFFHDSNHENPAITVFLCDLFYLIIFFSDTINI